MANLSFDFDGQSYVSDVFSGGKVVQLAFAIERTKVLYVETRLGSTLPWKITDSRLLEKQLVINIPAAGEGQEFRLSCLTEPLSAEIVPISSSGGSRPGPNTVGSEEIIDDSVEEVDLDDDVKKGLHELDDRSRYGTAADIDRIFGDGSSSSGQEEETGGTVAEPGSQEVEEETEE